MIQWQGRLNLMRSQQSQLPPFEIKSSWREVTMLPLILSIANRTVLNAKFWKRYSLYQKKKKKIVSLAANNFTCLIFIDVKKNHADRQIELNNCINIKHIKYILYDVTEKGEKKKCMLIYVWQFPRTSPPFFSFFFIRFFF